MALQSSGAISIQQINAEFNAGNNLNVYRGKFWADPAGNTGLLPGQTAPFSISMGDFYGKGYAVNIASNLSNLNLRTYLVNAGWNQTQPVIAYISAGVYISSNTVSTPALTVDGSFPGGLWIINNGFIVGMGGAGGRGRSWVTTDGTFGSSGGPALSVSSAVNIRNNGTIGGGGGGGGGGGVGTQALSGYGGTTPVHSGGGGGGGGRTGTTNSSGGAGGAQQFGGGTGGGGGAGTLSAGSNGGAGGPNGLYSGGSGGQGGGWGLSGLGGVTGVSAFSSGSTVSSRRFGFPGGNGGTAVFGNSNVTWLATGTRLGAIN